MATPLQQLTKTLSSAKKPQKIFYGWYIVGTAVVALTVIGGATFQSMGIFFVALERDFRWSRTLLSGAFSFTRGEGALLGPIEGFLTDRLGSRRMVLIGVVILGAGFLFLSTVQAVVSFYAALLVIFLGSGLGGWLPLMAAINQWFVRHRSKAMAIGGAGFNIGGLLVPLLAWFVSFFGWRTTALGLSLLMWALAIPFSLMIRNRPEEYGLRPDGDSLPAQSGHTPAHATSLESETNFTLGEALRTPAFWLITITHTLAVAAFNTVGVHIVPALTDMGFSLTMAGVVVATYTFTTVIFQLVGGFVGDRFAASKSIAIAVFVAIQGVSLVLIATMRTVPMVFVFAVLYGIGCGGRIPLLMAIRGDYFGRKNFATILGISQLVMNLITMAAPFLAGYLYDVLGSYTVPFLALAVLSLLAAVVILPTRKPSLSSARR